MKKSIPIFILFFLLIIPFAHAQSPWVKGKLKGYTQIGLSSITYTDVFDGEGEKSEIPNKATISDITLQSYTEFGLSERLGLVAILPYKILNVQDGIPSTAPNGNLSGLSNIILGAKYVIINKDVKFSGGLDISTSTFTTEANKGLRTGFEAWTINPYLSVGKGFNKFYAYGSAGYGWMSNDYSSFFDFNGEVGYNAFKRFYVMFTLDFVVNFENGKFQSTDALANRQSVLYVDRQSFLGAGLKTSYGFTDKFGINLSALGAFGGKNVSAAPAFNISVYYQW